MAGTGGQLCVAGAERRRSLWDTGPRSDRFSSRSGWRTSRLQACSAGRRIRAHSPAPALASPIWYRDMISDRIYAVVLTVEGIANQGESQRRQMGTDLVGAPGARRRFHQAVFPETLQEAQIGLGGLAALGVYDGAVAAVAVRAQRQVDAGLLPGRVADDQGVVDLVRLVRRRTACSGNGGPGRCAPAPGRRWCPYPGGGRSKDARIPAPAGCGCEEPTGRSRPAGSAARRAC